MKLTRRRFSLLASASLAAAVAAPAVVTRQALAQAAAAGGRRARNVILMISDGCGFHGWNAASYFEFGELGRQVYDQFPVKTLMTTFPLNTSTKPTNDTIARVSYDPAAAWSTQPLEGADDGAFLKKPYPKYFAGYAYVRKDYTDSAAAGTALAAGIKTYNNSINVDNMGRPVRMISEYAKAAGKSVGVVTSVQISHATPAAFAAHNVSRNNYAEIAQEMIETALCDVIMGAGHPMFDHDGRYAAPTSDEAFQFVGGPELFFKATTGRTAYQWIESKQDFEALAAGTLRLDKDKVLGVAQVKHTLQYSRSGKEMGNFVPNVPDLPTMTRGALRILERNPNGFFLMVEGGAVDWAAHANNIGRLIEEQIDFNRAVREVVSWIETHGGFEETLLIVTTDHGNGITYGPQSDRFAFQPIVNRGRGNVPEVAWHWDNHTNELVPLWANGPGAQRFIELSTGTDLNTSLVGWGDVSRYHDNTDVAKVMLEVLVGEQRASAN